MLSQTVNKIDAARLQLDRACRLFYCEGDLVCALALAAAARELLEGVAVNQNPRPLSMEAFLDMAPIQDGALELRRRMRYPQNFLKHFKRDPAGVLTIDEQRVELELFQGAHLLFEISQSDMTPAIGAARMVLLVRFIDPTEIPDEHRWIFGAVDPQAVTREAVGDLIRTMDRQVGPA